MIMHRTIKKPVKKNVIPDNWVEIFSEYDKDIPNDVKGLVGNMRNSTHMRTGRL